MLTGGHIVPDAKYPFDEYIYFYFAKEFGWTPEQTDEQPALLVDWIYNISLMVKEVENDIQQSALRDSSGK